MALRQSFFQPTSCPRAALTCSMLVRRYGASTGVLFIQMTDHVRDAYTSDETALTSRVQPDCAYKYYLAVAPFPSRTYSPGVGVKTPRPSRACLQLWSLGPSPGADDVPDDDRGEMRCELVLCIDSGPAFELKWCPLPSHDPVCSIHCAFSLGAHESKLSGPSPNSPRKLGLLAGVFEDGSLSVYVVPYPPDLASAQQSATTTDPIFSKPPSEPSHRQQTHFQ